MTERENVLHVIKRDGLAEWVPVTARCYDAVTPLEVVMRERPKGMRDGADWFGCHWTYDAAMRGFVPTPGAPHPVTDITKWREQTVFPELASIDWEGEAASRLSSLDRKNKLVVVYWESGMFERLHALTGFESAFVAMNTEPEAFSELMAALTDFRVAALDKVLGTYHPDALLSMDDYGAQGRPFMSADMFRELIKPHLGRFIAAVKSRGVFYFHHSCGMMAPFLGDLIELGADVVNPLQTCNGQHELEEKYGKGISFDGGFDDAYLNMPGLPEKALRAEVRRAIDTLGPYKNYILNSAAYDPAVSDIIIDEAVKYGAYTK